MSEIKVGDLVMVVRPDRFHTCPPGTTRNTGPFPYGKIFTVGKFWNASPCGDCGQTLGVTTAQPDDGEWVSFTLPQLKKIPPLSELESVTERETEKA